MVKCERLSPPPASLKLHRSYNERDVIEQLKAVFHDKCYICELKGLQDGIVEHRIPHKGDEALKFDWDNLFWACHHCNEWKNRGDIEYHVIDCCHDDPESHLRCGYDPYSSIVVVKPKDQEISSVRTALLIENVFNGTNTGIRSNAKGQRMRALQEEWNTFHRLLESYRANKTKVNRRKVTSRLRRESAFASFKRDYIREHRSEYPELQEFVS